MGVTKKVIFVVVVPEPGLTLGSLSFFAAAPYAGIANASSRGTTSRTPATERIAGRPRSLPPTGGSRHDIPPARDAGPGRGTGASRSRGRGRAMVRGSRSGCPDRR